MSNETSRSGRCNCGAVRFRVEGPLRPVVGCHCRTCRRQSGHHVAATAARRGDLVLEAAETLAWWSAGPTARRGFCARCGSGLFFEPLAPDGAPTDRISIWAGALDQDPPALVGHIFTGEKGGYYAVGDEAPCFAADWQGTRPEGW
ncbi:MAG: GFA family protein [Pseudomonadota bacterium]